MGMTIDEAIRRIDEHNYIHQSKEPRAVHITEAFNILIEVVKKYQKIEDIVKRYEHPNKEETDKFYWDVIGVIEDGNGD